MIRAVLIFVFGLLCVLFPGASFCSVCWECVVGGGGSVGCGLFVSARL